MTKYDTRGEWDEWYEQLNQMRIEQPERFCSICGRMSDSVKKVLPSSGRFDIAICVGCNRASFLLGLTVDEVVERLFRKGTPLSIDALYRASMHLNTSDTKDIRS